jgi:hypothetical protein
MKTLLPLFFLLFAALAALPDETQPRQPGKTVGDVRLGHGTPILFINGQFSRAT